jgi:hypothetical protein
VVIERYEHRAGLTQRSRGALDLCRVEQSIQSEIVGVKVKG